MTVIRSQCKDDAEYRVALRDDFAAAALPAVLAMLPDALPSPIPKETAGMRAAKAAYEAADAMLAERDKS